jgi:hypothetical protein
MNQVTTIIVLIALLAAFLIAITVIKYAVKDKFTETRLMMSALFVFIITTMTLAFSRSVLETLPYTAPAFVIGMALGYLIGVRTERQKIMAHGIEHYMVHFAHIRSKDLKNLTWWSIVNFYSIMCGLILVNLVGFTNVILDRSPVFTVVSSVVGALLIGSIVPYLAHLWTFTMEKRLRRMFS